MKIQDYSQTTPQQRAAQSSRLTLETLTATLLFLLPALLLIIFAS